MPAPSSGAQSEAPVLRADLDWRSVAVLLGGFVLLLAVRSLVRHTPRTLTWLALAVLLALALNPAVSAVQRRTGRSRPLAVSLTFAGLALVFGLLMVVLVPPAARQVRQLGTDAPRVAAQLGELPLVGPRLRQSEAPVKVERFIRQAPDRLTAGDGLGRITRRLADAAIGAVVTIVLAVALLLDAERLLGSARRLVPARWLPRAERMTELAYGVVGRYVAGSLLVAALAGTAVLVVGLVLGVPLSPLLGVWVALFDLVPQIGGAAGGIPFVFLGFTRSAGVGVACAVFFVLYLQLENHVLSPLIVGRAVSLSPPATMIAALLGVSAGGVVGALLAVPVVGAGKAVYLELRR